MPSLASVLTHDDLSRRVQGSTGLDLAPYRQMIQSVLDDAGVGGVIDLGPEEHQRTEKGRLTRAAREAGRQLVWRKSGEHQLKFVLAEPDGPIPGARRRRPRAEIAAEQTTIDAVMTEDVAIVTETTADADGSEPSPVGRRGRATQATAASAPAEDTSSAAAPRRGRPRKTSEPVG